MKPQYAIRGYLKDNKHAGTHFYTSLATAKTVFNFFVEDPDSYYKMKLSDFTGYIYRTYKRKDERK